MTQELVQTEPREVVVRPQVGLMLSIGEPPEEGRNYPKKLDHFRPKPGAEGQYADAATRFNQVYGLEPKRLDIVLLSNNLGDVLDIRLKAWGTSGLRAIGQTNYATSPDRMLAFDDRLTTFPESQREAGEHVLQGPDDKVIESTGLKLYGVFRFALPKVTGLTTLAEISTTSKRSMLNLLAGLQQVLALTGGHMAGIPFELAVRPARTRFFDEKKGKRATSTFYELVFLTPYAIDEFFQQVQLRRQQMSGITRLELPPVQHDDAERDREVAPGLWAGNGEPVEAELVVPTDEGPDDTSPEPDSPDLVTESGDGSGSEGEAKQETFADMVPASVKGHVDKG